MRTILSPACLAALSGCSAQQVQQSVAAGQLYRAVRGQTVATRTTSGQAILATGALKSAVDEVCSLAGGVAVSPPVNGAAGVVTVALPPSVTIPLKGYGGGGGPTMLAG